MFPITQILVLNSFCIALWEQRRVTKLLFLAPALRFCQASSEQWGLALPPLSPLGLRILTDINAVFNILKIMIAGSLFFSFAYPLITVLTELCQGTERSGAVLNSFSF